MKRNAPVGRRSWGGAQAPERDAVRGRTLPAPPHVYASPAPQHKPAPPPVHLTVVKPDHSGLGHGARARATRHDVLTPGQRALAGVAARHVHRRRCYPGGYVYEGASQP